MSEGPFPPLGPAQIAKLAETFRLIGDPTRLRILCACIEAPRPVGELAQSLGLAQNLVSHHLRLLREARLLRDDRQGKQVLYALDDAHISQMLRDMAEHLSHD